MSARYSASISQILARPRSELRRFDDHLAQDGAKPLAIWLGFFLIAVIGSCLYGASLSLVIPGFRIGASAAWLTLGAGLGWLVFGPVLIALTGRRALVCAQACMVTMAYGEIILALGAVVNGLIYITHSAGTWAISFNFAWVALSNIVMGASLAAQLQALGVPAWKTILAWVVFLDGSGTLFFWILYRALLS